MSLRLLIFLCIMLMIAACKEESYTTLDFTQITAVSADCTPIGNMDPTDWTSTDNRTDEEEKLLAFSNTTTGADSASGVIQIQPLCNNPSAGQYTFGFYSTRACKFRMVVVNQKLEILDYINTLATSGSNQVVLNYTNRTAFKKGYHRIYYQMSTAADSAWCSGHGDFLLEKE